MDDFIFVGPKNSSACEAYLKMFERLTTMLNIPLNTKKTVNPSTCVAVHGYEVDTIAMEVRLPQDKVRKAHSEICAIVAQKKVTLRHIQSVIGFLNFACAVVKGVFVQND